MKPFAYAAPSTLAEALTLLAPTAGETEILAGGTDLVTALKQGITRPKTLVSLRNLKELRGVEAAGETVRIGAMTPLGQVAEHEVVRDKFPAVVTAIQAIASPQLLSMGTIGGELCQRPRCWYYRNGFGLLATQGGTSLAREGDNRYHAIFATDGPALFVSASGLGPPLIALGASVVIAGPGGSERSVNLADFFRIPRTESDRETVLRPNEILKQIVIPQAGLRSATYEIRHRQGLDWPYITASVAFRSNNGEASDPRIVLGYVAPVPWVVADAARLLDGRKVDSGLATRCGEAATQGAQPLSRNAYKVQMVRTAVKRAILAAAGA